MTQMALCATPTQVTPGNNKRPDRNDPSIAIKVAEKLLPSVLEWMREDDAVEDAEIPEIQQQIEQALRDTSMSSDGYELAKELEDSGCWSPDSRLVEVLDHAGYHESEAVDELVAVWLVTNQMQPMHCVGENVQYNSGAGRPVKTYTGTIISIDSARGYYVVRVPELKHVTEGEGIYGTYVAWEIIDQVGRIA
jgi:hypothetical protein